MAVTTTGHSFCSICCAWTVDLFQLRLLYTGPPRGKYTNALCNMCNSEVRDLAPGRWICRNDHTVDSATSPEDQLPYRAWGRIQGALYLFPFLLRIHSTSTLCITLGLPLVDAHGTRLTVTMNSDAAECAFGSFSEAHTEPAFFSTGPRFWCTPFWPTPGTSNVYATRCERKEA